MEQACEHLRQLAAQGMAGKLKGAGALPDAVTRGLLALLQLKEDGRAQALEAEAHREETAQFRARLEQAHLQLQNLLYEKEYYDKEIHACASFRSAFADEQIGLVPAEEFLAQASKEVLAVAGPHPHQLMLQRLSHELTQRKALVAKLETLKKAKASTRQDVDRKRKVLDDLQQQLQGLEEVAKPLQTILAPHLSLRGMARNAELLPLPLYIIYSQLAAVKEALGLQIRVIIIGSAVEAESFAKSQAVDAGDAEGGAAAAAAAPAEAAANKRPRLSPGPAALSPGDDPYKVHPLSVLLEVQRDTGGRLQTMLSVKFQFLLNLKLVTAHSDVRDDNSLLAALFPGDDGSGADYESLAQLQGGSFKYDASRAARPYRWCQHLAGLDFAPPLPLASQLQGGEHTALVEGLGTYRKQQRVVHVIDRLRALKTGDEALKKILASLTTQPNPANLARYAKTPVSTIASCEEIKTTATQAAAAAGAGGSKDAGGGAAAGSSKAAAGAAGGRSGGGRQAEVAGSGAAAQRAEQQKQPQQEQKQQAGRAETEGEGDEDGEVLAGTSRRSGANTPAPDDGAAAGQGPAADGAGPAPLEGLTPPRDDDDDDGGFEEGEDGAANGLLAHSPEDDGMDASQLISAYLLSDLSDDRQAAAGGGGPSSSQRAAPPQAKPPSRLYRIVLRNRTLEVEVLARLFLEYPTRPPLLLVKAVREGAAPRGGGGSAAAGGKALEDVNLVHWLEAEANDGGLRAVPDDLHHQTLLYQLLHLRLALDEFAAMHYAAAAAAATAGADAGAPPPQQDLAALLIAKQKLRGRDRHLALPVLRS